jgi:peptide/nickel transport system substrate-binding protein
VTVIGPALTKRRIATRLRSHLRILRASAAILVVSGLVITLGAASGSASGTPLVPVGPLRIETTGAMWQTDPALAYINSAWEAEYATCAKLVNYPDAPPPEGNLLRPEIAAAMPTISEDGRTYTFQIRGDYAFSPPASGVVTAQSMKYTFERTLRHEMASPAHQFFTNIVGEVAFNNGQASEITGIVAQGNTLTFQLIEPQGDFLTMLAMPFTCAVPMSLPPVEQFGPIPSAGPYYVLERTYPDRLILTRNPNYTGSRPHHFDTIEYTFNRPEQEAFQRVEAGLSDYGPVPAAEAARVGEQYGPDSQAAGRGLQQFFVQPVDCIGYIPLNTERPLFANENMRKAVNFAIDRTLMAAQSGPFAGSTTDQYLPPHVAGYEDIDVYPMHPDISRARQLAGWQPGDPMRSARLYFRSGTSSGAEAEILRQQLLQIGIAPEMVGPFAGGQIYTALGRRGEPFDLAVSVGWCADYNDPWTVLRTLDGTGIQPENNINYAYFNDPVFNERLHAARALSGDVRYSTFKQIEHDLVTGPAPYAAWRLYNNRNFFSRRVGGHVFNTYGVDLAALTERHEITVGDVSVAEPTSGTATATFTVSLGSATSDAVLVDFATANGTAQAGADYTASSGTLTFAPSEQTKTVDVTVNADSVAEPAENFFLNLSNRSGATIVDGQGTATIADGTPPPPPPVRCRVPKVTGLRLNTARTRIRKAHCRTGRVRKKHVKRRRLVGRVLSQAPRPRKVRPRGSRVNLVVGRR